jgi:hypothetical protein
LLNFCKANSASFVDRSCEFDTPFFYTKENHLISGYLKIINDDGSIYNQFEIITRTDSVLYIPDFNFIGYKNDKGYFPMVKFSFPFLQLKYNVIPYLQAPSLIKFLYLLDKVKFRPRVSDGMRTNEAQLLYKRRGWSNIEASPHIIGAAMDLSYTPPEDKTKILSLNDAINIHYLEHGRRGNRHVHLQDNSIWNMDVSTYANNLSEKLNEIIAERIRLTASAYTYANKKSDKMNSYLYTFHNNNPVTLKIKFYDVYGIKKAEFTSGIYEKGNHSLNIFTDFLKRGVYKLIISNQDGLLQEKIIGVI